MEAVLADVRVALRRVVRAPGFTLFAIVSLALGIGGSTAIYSAVRTLFWTPTGIAQPDRLAVWTAAGRVDGSVSWPDFVDVRSQQSTFSSVGAARPLYVAVAIGDIVETVLGESVSGDYFATLGVTARLGRVLQPHDESSSARVAVVSDAFWRTRLHADPAILGRSITIAGQPFEVVGVIRGPFHGVPVILPGAVWIPDAAVPDRAGTGWPKRQLTDRALGSLIVWGRLKPGVSIAQAAADVSVIAQRLDATFPIKSPYDRAGRPHRRAWLLKDGAAVNGDADRIDALGAAILFAVATVLIIACTNLANLALARGTSRAQEMAVRTALGASRRRLIREHLIESGIVTGCGAGLGLLLLWTLTRSFETELPIAQSLVIHFKPDVNATVLLAAAGATTVALLVFGVWPALQSTRADVHGALGAGGAATPPRWRLHRGLVAWQVAGSVAMVLVAAMCVKVVDAVGATDPGVDYRHLALAQADFDINGFDEPRGRTLLDRILVEARRQPRVESVSASSGLPFGVMAPPMYATRVEEPFTSNRDTGHYTHRIAATPEIFATLGMRVVRGRGFTDRDDAGAPRVAILSEGMAREIFGTTDVVGRSISLHPWSRLMSARMPQTCEVVGVSKETDSFMLGRRGNPVLFVPLAQQYEPRITITARSADPAAAASALRAALRTAAPDMATSALGTGEALLMGPYFLLRIIARLAAALGTLALVLAMVGLHGVLSHVVARRTREIGIRLAVGADRGRIVTLVLRDGFRPVLEGLVIGLSAGVLLRLLLRATLVTAISPIDVTVFSLVSVPFLCAALLACWVPASRASQVDPIVALRDL